MRTRIVATISSNTIAPERERCVRARMIVATISSNTIAPEERVLLLIVATILVLTHLSLSGAIVLLLIVATILVLTHLSLSGAIVWCYYQ